MICLAVSGEGFSIGTACNFLISTRAQLPEHPGRDRKKVTSVAKGLPKLLCQLRPESAKKTPGALPIAETDASQRNRLVVSCHLVF